MSNFARISYRKLILFKNTNKNKNERAFRSTTPHVTIFNKYTTTFLRLLLFKGVIKKLKTDDDCIRQKWAGSRVYAAAVHREKDSKGGRQLFPKAYWGHDAELCIMFSPIIHLLSLICSTCQANMLAFAKKKEKSLGIKLRWDQTWAFWQT